MKSHNRVQQLMSPTGSTLEVLESRIAPATISAPGAFTYTDGDGDVVKVSVSGLFTSVDFLNDLGQDVAVSGGDVASVVVTKAGKNFAITVAAADVVGAGVVTLGNITGVAGERLPLIKGIYTVPSANNFASYELDGFRGTGFSVDGGLSVFGKLTGSAGNGAGLDITGIPKGTTVSISQGIAVGATATVGERVYGKLNIGGSIEGSLIVGSVFGQLLVADVPGSVVIQKDMRGVISTGQVDGVLEVQGFVAVYGRINSSADLNLKIAGALRGSVQVVGDLALDVGADVLIAEVLVGANLTLDVGGSVIKSRLNAQEQLFSNTGIRNDIVQSSIVGGTGIDLSVGRMVKGSRLSSGLDDMDITIGGNLAGSELLSGDDMVLTLAGSASASRILPDGQLLANVQRDVVKTLIGSQSSSAVVNLGGRMMASQLIAGSDATLTATGGVSGLDAIIGANAILNVGGDATKAKYSVGGELEVHVVGNLSNSILLPANTLSVVVDKNLQGSTLASFDNSTFVTVGGTMKGARIDSGESVEVTALIVGAGTQLRAAANVTVHATTKVEGFMIASGDVAVTTTGIFAASVSAGQDVSVTADSVAISGTAGGLIGGARGVAELPSGLGISNFRGLRVGGDFALDVAKNFKAPNVIVGGDVTGFHVGGDFSGVLTIAGDFVPGQTTESTTVIGGTAAKKAVIDIGGSVGSSTSSPKLIFGGAFLGRMNVGGKLLTDLEFGGNVNRLAFDGGVGPALLGDNIVDIIVTGSLASLTGTSLFQRTDAMSGKFVDGEGTVTGLLATTVAAVSVTPEDFTG
jgi:hypothetical protein